MFIFYNNFTEYIEISMKIYFKLIRNMYDLLISILKINNAIQSTLLMFEIISISISKSYKKLKYRYKQYSVLDCPILKIPKHDDR